MSNRQELPKDLANELIASLLEFEAKEPPRASSFPEPIKTPEDYPTISQIPINKDIPLSLEGFIRGEKPKSKFLHNSINEVLPVNIVENELPPEPKKRKVNLNHGTKPLFKIDFNFGTPKVFTGYILPDARFSLPQYCYNKTEKEETSKRDETILCQLRAQFYRVSKDTESAQEKYVDIGKGDVMLCKTEGISSLILKNDRPSVILKLLQKIRPRMRNNIYVQIFAEDLISKFRSIFLIKCENSNKAELLMEKIIQCVTE